MLQLSCTQRLLINIMKQGNIPQHISFIMDGNRRYAISKNKQSFKGHQQGKQSLKTYLLYCLQLGVKQTSFYCFSIQNFKRSQAQINKLMQLVINTFDQVSQVSQFVLKKNVKVRIIGRVQLFRKDVGQCLKKVQQRTKNNSVMVVNLCFAYDSIDEINTAIQKCNQSVKQESQMNKQQQSNKQAEQKQVLKQDQKNRISYSSVYNNLMIVRPVDILVRTSNESRMSNYMLMQNGYSLLCILKQNWPQINLFSLFKILLQYNYHYKSIQKRKLNWLKKVNNIDNKLIQHNKIINTNQQEQQHYQNSLDQNDKLL